MSLLKWFVALSIGWAIYTRPVNDSISLLAAEPYGVTAILNDSTWFGSAAAFKPVYFTTNSSCTAEQIDISFATDLPLSKRSKKIVTGCVGDCDPTQLLFFHNVPLAIGKYSLATLSSCVGVDQGRFAAEYWWMVGDDVISRNYASRIDSQGWVEVTKYDPNLKILEGTFEMDLIDYEKRVARFRKGVFKVKIIR